MDRKLRRAVLEQLAAAEGMAFQSLPVRAVRTQLKIITAGWRALLREHQPDSQDRCPVCSGWVRRRRWPCQVWVTAYQHLIGDGSAPSEGSGAKSARFRGPRQVEVIPRQVGTAAATDQIRTDRSAEEAQDHCQPTTVPIIPIHRAAVTERQTAMSRSQPGPRSQT